MIDITLRPVANQQLSIQLDGRRYDLEIKETNGCMSASVARDGVALLTMGRIVARTPLLPYRYQQEGNFVLTTEVDELPYFPQFGATQFLVYVSAAEILQLTGA